MRFQPLSSPRALFSTAALSLLSMTSALRMISSTSLSACSENPGFTATLFDVTFTPDNGTLSYNINADSTIAGNVTFNAQIIAYGITAYNITVDPCAGSEFVALCPLNPGPIPLNSNNQLSPSVVSQIPGIAYTVPDLDASFKVYLKNTTTGEDIACVEALLTNGKTVDQPAVQWVVAVIAGLALLVSAVISGLGHSNTAAHIAANALSLFGFFQAQALIGMTGVAMPPIVEAWSQNFQWSMGIVSIGFMQNVCTWYQLATGGTPSTLLSNLGTTSVFVEKRSIDDEVRAFEFSKKLARRGLDTLFKRATSASDAQDSVTTIFGIDRVGFRAGVEPSNVFLTGLGFFVAFVVIVAVCVALFKAFCELAVKSGWLKSDKFQDFRNGWKIVLKGILFRLVSHRERKHAILRC